MDLPCQGYSHIATHQLCYLDLAHNLLIFPNHDDWSHFIFILFLSRDLWRPPLILLYTSSPFTVNSGMTEYTFTFLKTPASLSAEILAFYFTQKVGQPEKHIHKVPSPYYLTCLHLYPHILTSLLVPYLRSPPTLCGLDLISSPISHLKTTYLQILFSVSHASSVFFFLWMSFRNLL